MVRREPLQPSACVHCLDAFPGESDLTCMHAYAKLFACVNLVLHLLLSLSNSRTRSEKKASGGDSANPGTRSGLPLKSPLHFLSELHVGG